MISRLPAAGYITHRMGQLNRAALSAASFSTATNVAGQADSAELAARVDQLTRELESARRALDRQRAREVDEARPRGLAREVLAATTAVAAMGTVVASVAMLTAWGVVTQLPRLVQGRKDSATDEP